MAKNLKINKTLPLALLSFISFSAAGQGSAEKAAGKVVVVNGQAEKISPQGTKTKLKEGMSVSIGDAITTSENSGVKVVLKDMTEMNVGPSSKFIIDDYQRDKPSIFSVAFGTLRAKVSKSLNGDVKAIIRTKSSTMGVRGTDFQTVFNEQTQMTSLVTFEGAVSMIKTAAENDHVPTEALVQQLTNPEQAVTVTQGQFSGVTAAQQSPTLPVKISPAQLESLRVNNPVEKHSGPAPTTTSANATTNGVKFISPVPPGVDAKLVTSSMADLKSAMSITTKNESVSNLNTTNTVQSPAPVGPPPEGSFNTNTGQIAPPAGGFVDMTTGLYIPPPPGSAFDPIAGVYVPPPSMGSFNAESGKYIPPQGFNLDATRGFVAVSVSVREQGSQNAPTTPAGPRQPLSGGLFPGMDAKQFGSGMVAAPPPPGMTPGQMPTGPGIMAPSAGNFVYSPGGEGHMPLGFTPPPGGFVPNFDGAQPQYPVYNPFVCPPYCDPQSQPGQYQDAAPAGTSTTGVSFDIS